MTDIALDRVLWPNVTPYPFQRAAIEGNDQWPGAEAALARVQSALMTIPTGGGKTVVFSELVRRYVEERDERVLVLAHTDELISQSVDKISRFGFGYESVPSFIGVEKAERTVDLAGMFAPSVVVASVQSMTRDNRLARFPQDSFGLVIVDECHHSTAASYRKILDYFRDTERDDDGVIVSHGLPTHVLGVTATPDRTDRRSLGDLFAVLAFQYEIREAIRDGHLVPPIASTGMLPKINLSKVRMTAGDLNEGDLSEAVTVMVDEIGKAIASRIGTRKTIAFLPTVDSAILLAGVMRSLGFNFEVVSGRDNEETRRAIVERFRDKDGLQGVCNCAVLTEGFDVPEVSCIANVRKTTSRSLYTQMLGRGLRLAPWIDKKDCLLLDFPGVGWNGKKGHQLCTPFDALGGITDADIAERAAKLLEEDSDRDIIEVMDQAAAEIEGERADALEKLEKARQVKAKRAEKETQLDLLGEDRGNQRPAWVTELVTVWGHWDGTKPRKPNEIPATEAEGLARIKRCKERKRDGLCSWRQAQLLKRWKLPFADVDKHTASYWIDGIAASNWREVPSYVKHDAAAHMQSRGNQ